MKGAPPLMQNTPVSNFMGKRMLESVFKIRKQACLVEKLRGLKPSETER